VGLQKLAYERGGGFGGSKGERSKGRSCERASEFARTESGGVFSGRTGWGGGQSPRRERMGNISRLEEMSKGEGRVPVLHTKRSSGQKSRKRHFTKARRTSSSLVKRPVSSGRKWGRRDSEFAHPRSCNRIKWQSREKEQVTRRTAFIELNTTREEGMICKKKGEVSLTPS